MIDRDAARAAAEEFLDRDVRPSHDAEIVIGSCEEYQNDWAFGYNTRSFVEQGDLRESLLGYGPIVVPKSGADPWRASSAIPVADQLEEGDHG